jgi:PEP-CTERM motif
MKRIVWMALLALILPTAALADTINDYATSGNGMNSSISGSAMAGSSFSIASPLVDVNGAPAMGTMVLSTGTLSACGSGLCFTGGTIAVNDTSNSAFSGTFSFSGTLTVSTDTVKGKTYTVDTITITPGNPVIAGFDFVILGSSGAIQKVSGDVTVSSIPEPGTLGLLGTGLVGLAGIARKKLKA